MEIKYADNPPAPLSRDAIIALIFSEITEQPHDDPNVFTRKELEEMTGLGKHAMANALTKLKERGVVVFTRKMIVRDGRTQNVPAYKFLAEVPGVTVGG